VTLIGDFPDHLRHIAGFLQNGTPLLSRVSSVHRHVLSPLSVAASGGVEHVHLRVGYSYDVTLAGVQHLLGVRTTRLQLYTGPGGTGGVMEPGGTVCELVSHAMKHCPQLVDLEVQGCASMTDDVLVAFVVARPKLKRLSVCGCPGVTDATTWAVARYCPELEVLRLYECPLVTPDSIVGVVHACPNLTTLALSAVGDSVNGVLESLAQHCRGLRALYLPVHEDRSSAAVAGALRANPSIRVLSLEAMGCPDVTGVASAISTLRDLEELQLGATANLVNEDLRTIASGARKLRTLCVARCTRINDEGMGIVAECWPDLVHLNLNGCTSITAYGVTTVVTRCRKLQSLDIGLMRLHDVYVGNPWGLTQELGPLHAMLVALGRYGKELRELNLSGVLIPKGGDLEAVLAGCRKLQRIRVFSLRGLWRDDLEKLQVRYPQCTFVHTSRGAGWVVSTTPK
jgi:hypothetical protein